MLSLNSWMKKEEPVFSEHVNSDEMNLIENGIIPKGWAKVN